MFIYMKTIGWFFDKERMVVDKGVYRDLFIPYRYPVVPIHRGRVLVPFPRYLDSSKTMVIAKRESPFPLFSYKGPSRKPLAVSRRRVSCYLLRKYKLQRQYQLVTVGGWQE